MDDVTLLFPDRGSILIEGSNEAGKSSLFEAVYFALLGKTLLLDVLPLYDSPGTLFYCDPPYPHASRGDSKAYGFEMTDADHRELAKTLHACRGKAAISGYRCDLMDSLYGHWNRFDAPEGRCHSVKQSRQESLWMNY